MSRLLLIFVVVLLLIFIWIISGKMRKSSKYKLFNLNKLYTVLSKIPIIGRDIYNIKKNIDSNNVGEESVSRYNAVIVFLVSNLLTVAGLACVIKFFGTNNFLLIASIILIFVFRQVLIEFLVGDDTELLEQFIEFLHDVQHNFNNYKDANRAIDKAISSSEFLLMKSHGKNIKKALESNDELELYQKKEISRFLKMFTKYSMATKELGDQVIDGRSLYIRNTNYIIQNLKIEVNKRNKLKYWLKGLSILAIIPIVFPSLIDLWAKNLMPMTKSFYESSWGFIFKVFVLIVTITCFMIINYLRKNSNEKNIRIKIKDSYWENSVLKSKLLNKLIYKIVPKDDSSEYFKCIRLINNSGSYLKIEWLYLHKLLYGVLGIVLSIVLIITVKTVNLKSITSADSLPKLVIVINGEQIDSREIESKLLQEYKFESDVEVLIKQVKQLGIEDDEVVKKVVFRVTALQQLLVKNRYITLNNILILLIISGVFFYIPNLKLIIQRKIRELDMKDEVLEFETIILLLMYYENVSIDMILEWMLKFSNVFYLPIQKALTNLQEGSKDALNALKEEVKYKPFNRLIDDISRAEDIEIKDIFQYLDRDRQDGIEDRKEENSRIISKKIRLASRLGLMPLITTSVVYMVIPFFITTIKELNNLSNILGR